MAGVTAPPELPHELLVHMLNCMPLFDEPSGEHCGYIPTNLRDAAAVCSSWRNAVVQLINSAHWKQRHHAHENIRTLVRQSRHKFYGVLPQHAVIARRLRSHPSEATAGVSLYSLPIDTMETLLAGSHVRVQWQDGNWYQASAVSFRLRQGGLFPPSGTFVHVRYADGDQCWHALPHNGDSSNSQGNTFRWRRTEPGLRQRGNAAPLVLPIHEVLVLHASEPDGPDQHVVKVLLEHHNASTSAALYWTRDDGGDPRAHMREGLAVLAHHIGFHGIVEDLLAIPHFV